MLQLFSAMLFILLLSGAEPASRRPDAPLLRRTSKEVRRTREYTAHMRFQLPLPAAALTLALGLICLGVRSGQAQTTPNGVSVGLLQSSANLSLLTSDVLEELSSAASGAASSTPAGTAPATSNSTFGTIEQSLSALQSEASGAQKTLHDQYGISVHGLVAASYLYNFDRPVTGNNLFRVYDYFGTNSVELDQGELYIELSVANQLGFVLDLNTFNTGFKQYGSVTTYWDVPGPRGGCSGSPCSWLDPTRAYLTYTIPVGSGIFVTAGNQYSLIGYETVPSWQNVNLFQSIGYVFENEPFTVDGIRAHYDFNSKVGLTLGVNNGWNAVASQSPLQSFEGQTVLKPFSWLTYTLAGMYGTVEANSSARSGVIDNIVTVTPTDKLSVTGEYYWGHQDAGAFLPTPIVEAPVYPFNPLLYAFPSGVLTHGANWWGTGTWIAYNLTERMQLGLRGEVFDDENGFLTGIPQQLWEVTTGFNYKVTEWLMTRLEYRHDQSTAHPFPSAARETSFACPGLGTCSASGHTFSGMDTVMVTVIYFF